MNETLIQKSGSKITTFSIEDTGLLIKTNSRNSSTEIHYPFEHIKTNRATALDHNKGALTVAWVFAGIAVLVFIISFTDKTVEWISIPLWSTISLALFVMYFRTRKRKLYLQTTESKIIEFLADNKTSQKVNNFIEHLLDERNSYLLSKYGTINRNLDYATQLENLNWLLNNRAISKEKYDNKIQELNSLFNINLGNKPIGFSASN